MTKYPTLPEGALNAIVYGYHGDPFSVLGPHELEDGLVIRAFVPGVKAIRLLWADEASAGEASAYAAPEAFSRIHDAGFFEIIVSKRPLPISYQLELQYGNDYTHIIDDPYNFPPQITPFDEHLMGEGSHLHIYEKLGAHVMAVNGRSGVLFAVWAPNAERVSVIGDFNAWDGRCHPMRFHHDSGIWELFIPALGEGALYKYEIKTHYQGYMVTKTDPVGFFTELRPKNASIVWNINKHAWGDQEWLENRAKRQAADAPINIYEAHLGSWKRKNGWEWLTYRELAQELVPYVQKMGYTHIELLPVSEFPFDGSWGYQVTGYFAPTSRYGTPDDFQYFVDVCHQAGIGVILDWVPAHFPKDQPGLSFFDGTHLYEHEDPRLGSHPDWGTLIFNYGRSEVRQFLISNALFWLDKYHIDGLRVDAVASMLYLDFSREAGDWLPNRYGGRENLEAIEFLKQFNHQVHEHYPDVLTIAEESTAWPGVSHPVADGGLGFNLKWNMGWMHDTLKYIENEPIHRAFHHGSLTFSLLYAFSEKFLLPFSHDEVVHLKKSMLDKMPGDVWQKFANGRLLYGYQYAHPGKKLLFMGSEIGQWQEWSEARSLDWFLLDPIYNHGRHIKLQQYLADLGQIYRSETALHQVDNTWEGFAWLDVYNNQNSILAFARFNADKSETIIAICNFTPVVRPNYRLALPQAGTYHEILNSDADKYGGGNVLNSEPLVSTDTPWHDQPYSLELTLPPLSAIYLKRRRD